MKTSNGATTKTATDDCLTTTPTSRSRTADFCHRMTPPDLDPHTKQVVWKDVCFLFLGCVAISIIGFVESHASEVKARSIAVQVAGLYDMGEMPVNPHGIVDTGFILTHPLYEWLKANRGWNDFLAGLNSLILTGPSLYIVYVTVWKGDYSLSFRVIALQLLRSFCGWFTYLPPDPTYLNSYYDFPDIVHCLFEDCLGEVPKAMPFVSFFSGHVASIVVVGNHMWLNGYRNEAVFVHALNIFQIVRLLATRGHYSIDIIIGWYVAIYVTNPAGRLGRYYSRGATFEQMLPRTPQEAFETMTGMYDARNENRLSMLLRRPEINEALKHMESEEENNVESNDTTARIVQEQASKMMHERADVLQEQIKYLQKQAALLMASDPLAHRAHKVGAEVNEADKKFQ